MFIRFWKKIGRIILLRLLIWTQKQETKPTSSRKSSENILLREVHVPTYMVAIVSSLALFVVLFFEVGLDPYKIIGLVLFIILIVTFFRYYIIYNHPDLVGDDDAMTLIGVVTILMVLGARNIKIAGDLPTFEWLSGYLTPVAASSMLITILLNSRLALVFTVIVALITGMIYEFSFSMFFVLTISGITGVVAVRQARQRSDITRAILKVGAGTAMALLIIGLFNAWPWLSIRNNLLIGFTNGVISGILTLSLLPFLETFFYRTTNIRLVELADFNQPLLKRLMIEAPGT
ncbi:MAG: hypothetical protein GF384_04370 [Elusimicrobia bacterium]|nr:hypothetical protein [Elusimicrobiota bacterium]MBD3412093.1 hypothetical protein [Elusimicrobiota bacterium]